MITTVGIITADRPVVARRALESIIRHCARHERQPRVIVVDGSRQAPNRHATRSAVAAVARSTGSQLQYIGKAEAATFVRALSRSGAPKCRLAPGSAGANRNLLLLLTAGESILTVDDDIVFDIWALPGRPEAIALTGHRDLRETRFFRSRARAIDVPRSSGNLLAEHEALLGRTLQVVLASQSEPVDLTHACRHLLSAVEDRRRSSIDVTFSGLAGDSGNHCPGWLLFASGPLREHLWSSRRAFETAMSARDVQRIAPARLITHDPHCMAYCMGLFNARVLPPFPLMSRNEDGVFGALLALCNPSTLFAQVPVGVVHQSHRRSIYQQYTNAISVRHAVV